MTRLLARCTALLLLVLLAACSGAPISGTRSSDTVLYDYHSAVRWNEFQTAWTFLDPAVRDAQPFSDELRERLKQVQVAGYEVKGTDTSQPGEIFQAVEIRWIDKRDMTEQVTTDHQRWRWDEAGKHWWLVSGLPAFDKP